MGTWRDQWVKLDSGRRPHRGGQGNAYFVTRKSDPAQAAFLKVLRNQSSGQARRRFVREATAYETLQGPGLPKLIEHNAHEWTDRRAELYLVLERVDGPTLGEYLSEHGPFQLDEAAATVSAIAEMVERCHREEVGHRDLKPANVMLSGGDLSMPVVVDFGLSFNRDAESEELTRVGEEVGNRFLRLPEHAFGSRDVRSDVTMLAGLLFFALTGATPAVLRDERNLPPHARAAARSRLEEIAEGRHLQRLLAFFDRAFNPVLEARFQSIEDLVESLRLVTSPNEPDDDVETRFVEFLAHASPEDLRQARAVLGKYIRTVTNSGGRLIRQHNISGRGPGAEYLVDHAMVPSLVVSYCLMLPSDTTRMTKSETPYICFRFALVNDAEVVLSVDGVDEWRGDDPTDIALADTIQRLLMEGLLRFGRTDGASSRTDAKTDPG